ncbi:MAG: glucose-6-phosphate isomerase [Hyphomicrobiaceae bacterium]
MDQEPQSYRRSGPPRGAGSSYSQDTHFCFAAKNGETGLAAAAVDERLDRLAGPLANLKASVRDGRFEHLTILDGEEDIAGAEAALAKLSAGAQTLIFLGTGGSSLGGQTLAQISGWNIPGGADTAQKSRPRTRFYDNLDPVTLGRALANLDLAKTRFVVTSKSGGTAETLTQMAAALAAAEARGLRSQIDQMFLAVSDPLAPGGRNALRSLCAELDIPVLDHPAGIGGRFSALSVVGLLPAIARGLDARAVRRGARLAAHAIIDSKDGTEARHFAPAIGAAIAVALAETRGVRVNVMMPYSDRLQRFGAWYVQLWAESLGKGGKGTTPLACLGPVDQHSQLQLFMDGPAEHYITIIKPQTAGVGPVIPADLAQRAGISFLAGRPVGDLVNAQTNAVAKALAQAGRPVRLIDVDVLDEHAIGALMMHFMLETVLAASLMGVDAFDQPAVELRKAADPRGVGGERVTAGAAAGPLNALPSGRMRAGRRAQDQRSAGCDGRLHSLGKSGDRWPAGWTAPSQGR